jgi:transposase-like protein
MKHAKRRLKCPNCGSIDTRRHSKIRTKENGVHSRWYCKSCKKSFTPRFKQLGEEGTRLYFDSGASYRAVGRKLNIEPKTAYRKIIALGFNCKSPMEVSLELKPTWSGYLVVDGDSILVGSHRESLLIGVDAISQDILHAILAEHEDGKNWTHFILVLKNPVQYPFRGIVSDGDPAIQETIKVVLPGVPYQYCVRHFEKELYRYIQYQFVQKRGYWREAERFLEVSKNLLYAKTYEIAKEYLLAISTDHGFKEAKLDEVINKIRVNFDDLTRHHFHPGMPRTSNIAEGVISRLDSKINQADGYKCHDTAWATLKMLIMRYRFKVFTDCRNRNKQNNGKSPLELSNVNVSKTSWIRFSQKAH